MSNGQMRLQCKSRSGRHVLNGLTMKSTVASLKQLITKVTNIPCEHQKIFYGYPPKHANLSDDNLQLSGCPFRSGDLLIVEDSPGSNFKNSSSSSSSSNKASTSTDRDKNSAGSSSSHSNSSGSGGGSGTISSNGGGSGAVGIGGSGSNSKSCTVVPSSKSSRRSSGMLIRKIVPANNACLFTSINTVMNHGVVDLSSADHMRKLAARIVMNDPETYSTALLGQENSKYVDWLLKEDSWGGAIEISVLSKHYRVEIDVVDTQSGRIDRFGEDQKYDNRVLLIYDGIHYDPLILELDESTCETVFSTDDDYVLQQALEIAAVAKANRQFTDVNKFTLRCLECRTELTGQLEAQQHAERTGHIRFGQI
ncbi:ubiquitin thioesterase OTU1 [Argonauta hians]